MSEGTEDGKARTPSTYKAFKQKVWRVRRQGRTSDTSFQQAIESPTTPESQWLPGFPLLPGLTRFALIYTVRNQIGQSIPAAFLNALEGGPTPSEELGVICFMYSTGRSVVLSCMMTATD